MWDALIQGITTVNDFVNGIVWGWPMIVLILGTGLLLTIRTKVMQVRKFKNSLDETIVPTVKSIGKKKDNYGKAVSQFEAFSAAISGTVGTGNIVGVTYAILTGGPGAVFWMWLSAFFGMITNYSENVLGLYFRKKNDKGEFSGGAFYYISNGLHQTWLGAIAAVFCLLAAIGMSGVQTNKISGVLATTLGGDQFAWTKWVIGIAIALLAALIILGGIKRIGRIASMLVPFMSVIFIILSVIAIGLNYQAIPTAFELIFSNIFGFKAMAGGFGGYLFTTVIREGMAKGVFSNEAGLGSSVIAHSASETPEPVKQGLWGIFEVFFDTFVICTLTALMVLTTNIQSGTIGSFSAASSDTGISLAAFSSNFGNFGIVCFALILPLFAFTTILAWSYYGEKATEFLFRNRKEKTRKIAVFGFKLLYILLIIPASAVESKLVWKLSDTFNGLMALPNLVAVILLSGLVVRITKNYYDRKKGLQVAPMLSAYPELNAEFEARLEK